MIVPSSSSMRLVFGETACCQHEAALAVRDVDERLRRIGPDGRLEPRPVVLRHRDRPLDDSEVLLGARAVGADAGREVDAQPVVFRAVVDLRLDVDAGERPGYRLTRVDDLAVNQLLRTSPAPVVRQRRR